MAKRARARKKKSTQTCATQWSMQITAPATSTLTTHPHLFHPSTAQARAWFLLCWVVWSLGPIHTHIQRCQLKVLSCTPSNFHLKRERFLFFFFFLEKTEEKHESNDWLFCQKVRVTWRLWARLPFSEASGVGKRISSTLQWLYVVHLHWDKWLNEMWWARFGTKSEH